MIVRQTLLGTLTYLAASSPSLSFSHFLCFSLRVSNKHGRNISHHSTNRLELTDVFQSSHSFKSIFCRLNIMFAVVWVYAKIIFTGKLCVCVCVCVCVLML